jgi:lipopolysaccharide transport system permease protein
MLLAAYIRSSAELGRGLATHRRLLVALMKRELSDEYVTHHLSIGWNFIHPLFLMLVYLFVFIEIFPVKVVAPPGLGADVVVYLLAGFIPWLALQQVMSRAAMSVAGNSAIVKQMSFPLELLPIKTLAGPAIFTAVSLGFLIGYSAWISGGSVVTAYIVGLPPLLLLTMIQFAGLALLVGSIQVFFRDFKEFINIFLTVGLFIHPILYLPHARPAVVRPIIYLSPFSYLIFCWHDVLFYGAFTWIWAWAITALLSGLFFVIGARIFLASKPHFGDFL